LLRTIFDFYVKLENLGISVDLEIKANSLPTKGFVKFANQIKFVPGLVTAEEIVMIYKLILKEKAENYKYLNYDDFIVSLVRVAIRGNSKLSEKSANEANSKMKEQIAKTGMLFFDVKEITADTLENLMKYMGLGLSLKKKELNDRLISYQHEGVKSSVLKQKTSMVSENSKELQEEIEDEENANLEPEPEKNEGKNEETQISGEFAQNNMAFNNKETKKEVKKDAGKTKPIKK